MFEIEKRIDRSKSKQRESKNDSKPPLPTKKTEEKPRVAEEPHAGEQEPISKPSEVKEKINSPLQAEEHLSKVPAEENKT